MAVLETTTWQICYSSTAYRKGFVTETLKTHAHWVEGHYLNWWTDSVPNRLALYCLDEEYVEDCDDCTDPY